MGEKDLFYDLLANPQLALGDLEAVGHSAKNSRLYNKEFYKGNEKVRAEFTKEDGTFDEKAFDQKYSIAAHYWKGMTDDSYNKNLVQYTSFDKDNIFIQPKYRTLNDAPVLFAAANPTRDTYNLFEVGKKGESGKSIDEIAQAEKVLLNPVEVEKGAEPIWGESPNDEWWSNPFSTRVLAKYDSAGYHVDPITGEKTWHEKDELKINSNGTHFYEDLDGRDIYGRQVLNKFNTLTTDGSWWNQYDFLDSDDLNQKSVAGSIAKNLALVGSMFIPYVGWGIAAASVATQLTGLAGTFGKMLTGSDNPTLSAMEGFAQSWNRQGAKTQYAQQNMLCWENFIDLIGDTTAQLREQRAIFKFAPAILKGKYGAMGKEGAEILEKEKTAQLMKDAYTNKSWEEVARDMYRSGKPTDYINKVLTSGTDYKMMSKIASKQVEDYFTSYNKLGEQIARAYMVGITVGDTYGEAKAAGATDGEAAWLTAGYAAMENALLSTDLGRWIFPELKGNKIKYKAIAETFAGLPKDVRQVSTSLTRASNETKKNWVKRLFNAGKEAAKKDYSLLHKTAGAVLANGFAEGTEEVSEELLADFSKACFNTYKTMTGGDPMLDTWGYNWDWNEAAKRYGMSFFGGVIGGGINGAATDFTQIRDYSAMTHDQAMQHLTWMARNDELGEFWKTVNKMELGNSQLGTQQNADGTWKVGTKNDNQDLEVKKLLRNTITSIQNIVNAEGANLDDSSFIGNLINANPKLKDYDLLKDLRTEAIANSSAAGKLIKNYNTLIKDIVNIQLKIDNIQKQKKNDHAPLTEEEQAQISELTKQLEEKRKQKDDIINGKFTNDLYRRSLFEATYALTEGFATATEEQYVRTHAGKSLAELTPDEKETWHQKYVDYCKSEKAEDIEFYADLYHDIAKATSKGLTESIDFFNQLKEGQLPKIYALQNMAGQALTDILQIIENGGEAADVQNYVQKIAFNTTGNYSDATRLAEDLNNLENNPVDEETLQKFTQLKQTINATNDPEIKARLQAELDTLVEGTALQSYSDTLENKISRTQYATGGIQKFIQRIGEIFEDPELQVPSIRGRALRKAFYETVGQDLLDAVKEAKKVGFIHPEVRVALRNALEDFRHTNERFSYAGDIYDNAGSIYNEEWAPPEEEVFSEEGYLKVDDEFKQALEDLEQLPNTPIQKILDTFTTSLKTGKTVSALLEEAIGKQESHKRDMENVALYGEADAFDYDQALMILEMVRQGILGAKLDGADLENLYGYNKTLNDLIKNDPGFVELATIDHADALYALQDVNMAINRLKAMKSLHEVNSGNKLNAQNHASVNKNLIMFNRMRRLIVSIRDDDDKADIKADWDISELEDVITNKMKVHEQAWGDPANSPDKNVSERTLGLNGEQRVQLEKEALLLENAIYDFFNKHISNVRDPKKLSRLLDYFNYINSNSGILNKESQDIDDNAFTWWLASKAALRASDFSAVFTKTMDGADVDRPIAPIPTQELGVYAGVAAIFNGNMFKHFAQAMSESIYNKWKTLSKAERLKLLEDGELTHVNYNGGRDSTLDVQFKEETTDANLKKQLSSYSEIYNSDVIPYYVNTLFIEGIAGSGKSTGVFKSILRILFDQNPEIAPGKTLKDSPIFFAHGTKKNADDAVATFDVPEGWNFRTFDKTDLLKFFTDDYEDFVDPATNEHQYFLKTSRNQDGNIIYNKETKRYETTWRIKNFSNPEREIPKVMFIDEWSHYTQPEIDFLQRVSERFGIQIIAGGDLDQITPKAGLYKKLASGNKRVADMTIDRNSFPRIQKLGVSMRTGNGQKTENQNRVRIWRNNRSLPIELTHLEVDGQLYGDKVYNADGEVTDAQLAQIKEDIQKMVATLQPDEKIGYIHSYGPGKSKSKIYKMIEDNFGQYFDFYSEKAAQGREARYYVVENNRELTHQVTGANGKQTLIANNPEDYHEALYTGITRAEQATIVIAPSSPMGDAKMGTISVKNAAVQPTKLIPDGYTGAGIKKYTQSRKEGSAKALEALKNELGITEDPNSVKLTYVARQTVEREVPEVITGGAASLLNPEPEIEEAASESNVAESNTAEEEEPQSNEGETAESNSEEPDSSEEPENNPDSTEESEGVPEEDEQPDMEVSVIYPRGTELYDNRPGMNLSFSGAIMSYDSDTKMYQITMDGENIDAEVPYEVIHGNFEITEDGTKTELPLFDTLTPEEAEEVGTVRLLEQDRHRVYEGKYPIGSEIYDYVNNELVGVIEGFRNGEYLLRNGDNTFTMPEDFLEGPLSYQVGRTTVPKYHMGDTLHGTLSKITITGINRLNSGGYSYEVQCEGIGMAFDRHNVLQEEELDKYVSERGFKLNQEIPATESSEEVADNPDDNVNQQEYEQILEEVLEETDTLEEAVEIEGPDITFSVFGHTFNTFYTGLDFQAAQEQGKPLVPQEGEIGFDRIDVGIGLYKIDPSLCQSEQQVVRILGELRSAAMYHIKNENLIQQIKKLIPKLKSKDLEIKWALISKSEDKNFNSSYAKNNDRFTPPLDGTLRNMPENDENQEAKERVPLKTISLVIREKGTSGNDIGTSLLEIPMVTLTSPQTILYKIGAKDPENPVYKAFIQAAQNHGPNPGQHYVAINAVLDYINGENGRNLGKGYQRLADLCKLWLFNNDGVRFIGGTLDDSFNFARAATNLGVKFVKERMVEAPFDDPNNPPKNNYSGKWNNLTEEAMRRPEVTYSSIMMSTDEFYSLGDEGTISIAAPGHPFVLRLDGPADLLGGAARSVSDQQLMAYYIKQLKDEKLNPDNPKVPKMVKLVYVSPPEATIPEYLELMEEGKNNPYGNGFTSYRILSAVYNKHLQEKATGIAEPTLWEKGLTNFSVDGNTKDDLEKAIKTLYQIEVDNPPLEGENHAKHLSRIVKLQKEVMLENLGWVHMMNSALMTMSHPNMVGGNGVYAPYVQEITKICNEVGITGILRAKAAQEGNPIAGYALKLKVSATDKFLSPEGKPWRIFSKFDSPTFDLSFLLDQYEDRDKNILSKWANQAVYSARGRNPRGDAPKVWYFNQTEKIQKDYYLAGSSTQKKAVTPPAERWRKKHANLLEKLGLKGDIEFGNQAQKESEFLQQIADYWAGKTDDNGVGVGNISLVIDGKTIFCGNMDDSNTEGTKLPEVYKHLRQKDIEKSDAEPNMYLLTMVDDRDGTNYQVKVEILPDSKKYSIYFLEEKTKQDKPFWYATTLQDKQQQVTGWLQSKRNPSPYQKEIAEKLLAEIRSLSSPIEAYGGIEESYVKGRFAEIFENDEDTLEDVALALGEEMDYFENLESEDSQEESNEEPQENELMWCPIPIGPKNFM